MQGVRSDELDALIPPPPQTVVVVADKELRQSKSVDDFLRLKPRVVGEFHVVGPNAEPIEVTKRRSPPEMSSTLDVSIVIPTFREQENLQRLLPVLFDILHVAGRGRGDRRR